MKVKVSLVLILLMVFCLHKIDKKHLVFHSHAELGCHSYIENRENTDNFHGIYNQKFIFKQGKSQHTFGFIQDNERVEIETESIDIQFFDIVFQVFSNNYLILKHTIQTVALNTFEKIALKKLYVIINVFRI